MKRTAVIAIVTMWMSCAVGFWLYGAGRTICESTGLDGRAQLAGMLIGVLLPASAICVVRAVIMYWSVGRQAVPRGTLVSCTVGLLLGSVLSESCILWDEHKFAAEVSGLEKPYSRPRAWPNGASSLVFVPGSGIHSTD